jgi:hypothetical protein
VSSSSQFDVFVQSYYRSRSSCRISKFRKRRASGCSIATDEGKILLRNVSRLVRRNDSKSSRAGTPPRERALKAITDSEKLEFAPEFDFASWSRNHSLFWTINVAFGGRTHINILCETLASRFKMLTYLDDAKCSLRIQRQFLCLFHDFTRLIQPNAERIGGAMLQSNIHQLRLWIW